MADSSPLLDSIVQKYSREEARAQDEKRRYCQSQ